MANEPDTIEKDAEIIEKYIPSEALDELAEYSGGDDLKALVEATLFTPRELAAYLLAERSNMTWQEAAEEMGIDYGTYSGKMGNNVKRKKERAHATVRLINIIEGE